MNAVNAAALDESLWRLYGFYVKLVKTHVSERICSSGGIKQA